MSVISRIGRVALPLAALFALCASGCMQGDGKPGPKTDAQAKAKKDVDESSKHDGWWCDEHGIPEAECSMCSKKVANACKAKGDWCDKHDRAKSQCFKCDPSLKEVYAAKYRAHYPGKEPPPFEDD